MTNKAARDSSVTRVLVWSDRPLFAECLAHHFATAPIRLEPALYRRGDSGPADPSVCLRDVEAGSYPRGEQARILDEVTRSLPSARVLIVSSRPGMDEVPGWIAAGAHGYFSLRSNAALLTAATLVVAAGGLFVPEELVLGLLSEPVGAGRA